MSSSRVPLLSPSDSKSGQTFHACTCSAVEKKVPIAQPQPQPPLASLNHRRGWVVFWDIENMSLWKRYNKVSDFVTHVTRCISTISKRSSSSSVTRFNGIGNISRVPNDILNHLQQCGVTTIDCSQRHKNAADLVIVTEMMRSLMECAPEGVCLISNDGGFSHCLTTINQLGYETILLHDQAACSLSKVVRNSINLAGTYVHKQVDDNVPLAITYPDYFRKTTSRSGRSLGDNGVRALKLPPPAITSPRCRERQRDRTPDRKVKLKQVIRMLELNGGSLQYEDLQRRLGKVSKDRLTQVIEVGNADNRLTTNGSYISLK